MVENEKKSLNYKKLYSKDGFEIWFSNGEYLVLNKIDRYGKFYKTMDEAVRDPKILDKK